LNISFSHFLSNLRKKKPSRVVKAAKNICLYFLPIYLSHVVQQLFSVYSKKEKREKENEKNE